MEATQWPGTAPPKPAIDSALTMDAEQLREETLESQKVRSDLLKWKLLLVAALGSAGLGLGQVSPAPTTMTDAGMTFELVLCLIPLVCLYVDLLCSHMTVRMHVIGIFLKTHRDADDEMVARNYERFADRVRHLPRPSIAEVLKSLVRSMGEAIKRVFSILFVPKLFFQWLGHGRRESAYELEDWALQLSTYILSFLVFVYGLIYLAVRDVPETSSTQTKQIIFWASVLLFLLWGLAGIFGSLYLRHRFKRLVNAIETTGEECLSELAGERLLPEGGFNRFVVHNGSLADRLKKTYEAGDIRSLRAFLTDRGVFRFQPLANGLFPAACLDDRSAAESGYKNVWVRDNFYVAYAHYVAGDKGVAIRNAHSLAEFFRGQENRFRDVIEHRVDWRRNPMDRPHVRFNGRTLKENPQQWAHDQNDALGYFLWFQCRLALDGAITPEQLDPALIALFPRYLDTIEFWQDEDSGHWEEARKVSASSIGIVVGALELLREVTKRNDLEKRFEREGVSAAMLKQLIDNGRNALRHILPAESVQPGNERMNDGALLFLIYPLELDVISSDVASQIIENVEQNLLGPYGIRRYLGDSYWFPNYKEHYAPAQRSADFSNSIKTRDEKGTHLKSGQEAQWCIFDPILSAIFGSRFLRTGDQSDLQRQTYYLNRSLGQVTGPRFAGGPFLCPEAYYRVEDRYVPNDHTPLLWTQANLLVALHFMEKSLAASGHGTLPM
jgi:phosphorylase kinase alpha/beta subunit